MAQTVKKTNFDAYLAQHIKDLEFMERYRQASEAWDAAIRTAELRKKAWDVLKKSNAN